jgi:hypothetical protein
MLAARDMTLRARLLPLWIALAAAVPACRKDEPPTPVETVDTVRQNAVERCSTGIDKAITASTFETAAAIYYAECADLYSKAPCRDAWRTAAAAAAQDQGAAIAEACRKAYCPDLASLPIELCTKDFPLSGPRFEAAWAQFFGTVLEREGGESLTPSLLMLIVRLAALKAQDAHHDGGAPSAAPSSGAPSASGMAAPSAAPSSKAAPSAASAKPGTAPAHTTATATAKKTQRGH